MHKHDLVVIGGGAGGLVVASVAAQLGLDVVLIEARDKLGGDCLHSGCVPSKTLLHIAGLRQRMRQAQSLGFGTLADTVDMTRVAARVQSVIDTIQVHDDPQRFRDYGCEVLFGTASFVDAGTVSVGDRHIRGRRFVLATGSRPAVPAIEGLADVDYLTNETVFSLAGLPGRLAVLGGGPIGVELAQAFARLGSRVTLIEQQPNLLPNDEPALTTLLAEGLREEGIDIRVSTRVERVAAGDKAHTIHCDDDSSIETDRILVALGRQPNTETLALDAAGVRFDTQGVKVDARLRTSRKHIYACGDICGPWQFTHMAEYQAGVVISNAVFRWPKKVDYRVVPRVTYSEPELAQVGLTEAQAQAQGLKIEVLTFPMRQVDRALIEGRTRGQSRLLVHRGRIVGGAILGPHAGELIHEIALAMQAGVRASALSTTIHAYPTLAQVHRRTVNSAYAGKLFSPATRRLVRLINRVLP